MPATFEQHEPGESGPRLLPPRAPDGAELAGLLSALSAEQHPAIADFTSTRDALEFLLDRCTIAVFDRHPGADENDLDTVMLLMMDQGPAYASIATTFSGAHTWRLAHLALDDFPPSAAPSRHSILPQADRQRSVEPRSADDLDLREFLRMFKATHDPYLMEVLTSDAARLDYLCDQARIAIFDWAESGDFAGSFAFFLWPAAVRSITVAIKTTGSWRFSSGEVSE